MSTVAAAPGTSTSSPPPPAVEPSRPATPPSPSSAVARWIGASCLAFLVCAPLASIWCETNYAQSGAASGGGTFEVSRAMAHLQAIASEPHPVGSAAHDRVRDYLKLELEKLGFETRIARAIVADRESQSPFEVAAIENVIARRPGLRNTKPLVLAAHYDSVPVANGAADDGAGVVSILEAARAIAAKGWNLDNDLVVLFSDAEETGLLGALAAVEDPWVRHAGAVLNWDARGARGPVLLFETSPGNELLIRELASSGARPVTGSAMGALYRLLGFGTDFTVFRKAGLQGLNFAFIDGPGEYHSRLDDIAHLDPATLRDVGTIMVRLIDRLGRADLSQLPASGGKDAAYFTFFGRNLIVAGAGSVQAFALVGVVGSIAMFWFALRIRVRRDGSWLAGAGASVFAASLAYVAAGAVLWFVTGRDLSGYLLSNYQRDIYSAAFVLIAAGCVTGIHEILRRRFDPIGLAAGNQLLWLIFTACIAWIAPEASYLLSIPLVTGAAGLFLLARFQSETKARIAAVVLTAGSAVLVAPFLRLLLTAGGLGMSRFILVLAVIYICSQLPALDAIGEWLPGWAPSLASAAALVLVAFAFARSSADSLRPLPDNLFYTLNGSTGQAFWASSDDKPDDFTRPFLSAKPQQSDLAGFVPPMPMRYLTHEAPAAAVTPPAAELLSSEPVNGLRQVRLMLRSTRGARTLALQLNSPGAISGIALGEVKLPDRKAGEPWGFSMLNLPPEGVELHLSLHSPGALAFTLFDQTTGLPAALAPASLVRPLAIASANRPFADALVTSNTFSF